jgi:hypothetical protein
VKMDIHTHINEYNIVYKPILSFLFISLFIICGKEVTWQRNLKYIAINQNPSLKNVTYRQFETQVIKQCSTLYLGLQATNQNSQILQDGNFD